MGRVGQEISSLFHKLTDVRAADPAVRNKVGQAIGSMRAPDVATSIPADTLADHIIQAAVVEALGTKVGAVAWLALGGRRRRPNEPGVDQLHFHFFGSMRRAACIYTLLCCTTYMVNSGIGFRNTYTAASYYRHLETAKGERRGMTGTYHMSMRVRSRTDFDPRLDLVG